MSDITDNLSGPTVETEGYQQLLFHHRTKDVQSRVHAAHSVLHVGQPLRVCACPFFPPARHAGPGASRGCNPLQPTSRSSSWAPPGCGSRRCKGGAPPAMRSASRHASDYDTLDLVDRHPVRRPVVELRRLRRCVARDLLRVLERPAIRQVRRDPRRPETCGSTSRLAARPPRHAA